VQLTNDADDQNDVAGAIDPDGEVQLVWVVGAGAWQEIVTARLAFVRMVTQVNSGPYDATPKTAVPGDYFKLGIACCPIPPLSQSPISVLVNVGPAPVPGALTIPPYPIPNLVRSHAYSTPAGAALLLGDGLGLAAIGVGLDLGVGPTVVTSYQLAIPMPWLPPGTELRFQAIVATPAAVPFAGILVTNELVLQL
jgi:hypothetical protein